MTGKQSIPDTTPSDGTSNPTYSSSLLKTDVNSVSLPDLVVSPIDKLGTSLNNQFGQNEFSVAISSNSKMRFSTMESSMKDCILLSDSQRNMKSLHENITKAITFVINQELELLPSFNELHRRIDFESLFLSNFHGATLSKCKPIFLHFRTIICACLLTKDCIDPTKCPKAS